MECDSSQSYLWTLLDDRNELLLLPPEAAQDGDETHPLVNTKSGELPFRKPLVNVVDPHSVNFKSPSFTKDETFQPRARMAMQDTLVLLPLDDEHSTRVIEANRSKDIELTNEERNNLLAPIYQDQDVPFHGAYDMTRGLGTPHRAAFNLDVNSTSLYSSLPAAINSLLG